MKTHDFAQSIIVGAKGEEIIKKYLASSKDVKDIKDVSSIRTYQLQDIDLLITLQDDSSVSAEIKTDTYTSGNIFFETMSNLEHNVAGCMYKTKADYLFYYFTQTKELYIMNMEAYRNWFEENKANFNCKKLKNRNRKNDGTYTSVGYTIPKVFLEANFREHQKIII